MIAAIIITDKPPLAMVLPFTNLSNKVTKSLGILETMLIISTIEIPFPTPFSVICSPIHINIAEPAVKVATATTTLVKFMFVSHPLFPNPIAIVTDWNSAKATVT